MDLISELKGIISPQVAEHIGDFLGEDKDMVANAINLAVPSFLGGLLKYSRSEAETAKIMKVLHDGGHSGDILENVNGLLSNFEKTQLIITIGNNIVTHFFGARSNQIIEKISDISGVKKTSASSLLSISAPLILGLIGRKVKSRSLEVSGLSDLLNHQNEMVVRTLPPAISNALELKTEINKDEPQRVIKPVKKEIPEKSGSETKWKYVLPWIFLAALGAGSLYYFYSAKKKKDLEIASAKALIDSTDRADEDTTINPAELLSPVVTDSLKVAGQNKSPEELALKTIEEEKKPAAKTVETPSKPVAKTEEVTTNQSKSLAEGWSGIRGLSFERNSAAIRDSRGITELVTKLKANQKDKIYLAPVSSSDKTLAEDRSYAIRDLLIENGIDESRIVINRKDIQGPESNAIAFRIGK